MIINLAYLAQRDQPHQPQHW